MYPTEGQPDVLGAIRPAPGHIPRTDKSKVAVVRPCLAPEAQYGMNLSLIRPASIGSLDKVKTLINRGAEVNPHDVLYSPTLPSHIESRFL